MKKLVWMVSSFADENCIFVKNKLFLVAILGILFITFVSAEVNLPVDSLEIHNISNQETASPKYYGYIIEFEGEPLVNEWKILQDNAKANEITIQNQKYSSSQAKALNLYTQNDVPAKLKDYRNQLDSNNNQIKNNIKNELSGLGSLNINWFERIISFITGNAIAGSTSTEKEIKVIAEWNSVFNGIALNITDEEAEKIKNIPGVKSVSPNYLVQANLMDSVTMMGVNNVWKLDKDGNNCLQTGKECLTGKGMTIGIIDTGVDYTHPDLGKCDYPSYNNANCFQKNEKITGVCNGNTPANEICKCSDADGGINICFNGELKIFTDSSTGEKLGLITGDYCNNSNSVVEHSCSIDNDSKVIHNESIIPCPAGTKCFRGACVSDNFDFNRCNKVTGGWNFVECNNFNLWTGECLDITNPKQNPMDDHGHGTHCAGIAAGSGIGGLKGVAPDAQIYAYKVLNYQGAGLESWIMSAINRSMDPNLDGDFSDHLDVISLSLGGDGNPDDPQSKAIDNAVNAGVIAVIAAGNSGPESKTIGSPGTARKAITVGAVDKSYNIAEFSSRGPVQWVANREYQYLNKPDVVAPGVNICSAEYYSPYNAWDGRECLDEKHMKLSGTSMATPHVAGAVALLKQRHPDWSPDEIKQLIKNTATDLGFDINSQGYGIVNLSAALKINSKNLIPVKKTGILNITSTPSGAFVYIKNLVTGEEGYKSLIGNVPIELQLLTGNKEVVLKKYIYENIIKSANINENSKTFINEQLKLNATSPFKKITSGRIRFPSINKDKIVWTLNNGAYLWQNCDMYLSDLSTSQIKKISENNNQNLAATHTSGKVFNNNVSWIYRECTSQNCEKFIEILDLKTNIKSRIPADLLENYYLDFSENKIVWIENYGENYDKYNIRLYDLDKKTLTDISDTDRYQGFASINNNKIFWGDGRSWNSYPPDSIYMKDLSNNQKSKVYPYNSNFLRILYPKAYNNYVIFLKELSQISTSARTSNLTLLDMNTGNIKTLANNKIIYGMDIDDNKVVWIEVNDCGYIINLYDILNDKFYYDITENCYNFELDLSGTNLLYNKYSDDDVPGFYMDLFLFNTSNIIKTKVLPQSKLVNNNNYPVTGNLNIKIQKDVSGTWNDFQTIVNQQATIPANGLIKLDTGKDNLGNQIFDGFNNMNIQVNTAGNYRVYTRFELRAYPIR